MNVAQPMIDAAGFAGTTGECPISRPDRAGHCRSLGVFSSSVAKVACPIVLATFFAALTALTWQRWTVPAFPLDSGREMIVSRLLCEGRILYQDIRCFYGPTGYWLNALPAALFGPSQNILWLTNLARFAVTLVLLYLLGRRLLSPTLAALALASFSYAYFYSLLVPYSASVGWGVLLLTGASLAFAKGTRTAGLSGHVLAALLLSLTATTKHEYAFTSGMLLVVLLVDMCASRPRPRHLFAVLATAVVPFLLVWSAVLTKVSWHTVIHENLWMPELLKHFSGAAAYGPGQALTPWKTVHLLEWSGLLLAAAALVSVWSGRIGQRIGFSLVATAAVMVVAAEWFLRHAGLRCTLPMSYPKPRALEIIEMAALLIVPLTIVAAGVALLQIRRLGVLKFWGNLRTETRVGIFVTIGALSLITRQLPTAIEMVREPFTAIAFVWLLVTIVPDLLQWALPARRFWHAATAVFLLTATAAAGNNIRYYQTRPSFTLESNGESTFGLTRRKPFTAEHFNSALKLVQSHRASIGTGPIACVPEGAWLNAICHLEWPTRDTQWMPFCQKWVAEDLRRQPPDFILLMETLEDSGLNEVRAVIESQYVPMATNTSGMTLLRYTAANGPHNSLATKGIDR